MLDTQHVWYSAEEIFFKQGTTIGRTPWHQDTAYAPYGGKQWSNLWISFESLPRWNSLEAVRSSHYGPQYDDPDNPAKPLHGGNWTPLPDIEREHKTDPDAWPILSYPSEPGDLIIFHPHSLHGGGPLGQDCPIRHTLVFRSSVMTRSTDPCRRAAKASGMTTLASAMNSAVSCPAKRSVVAGSSRSSRAHSLMRVGNHSSTPLYCGVLSSMTPVCSPG